MTSCQRGHRSFAALGETNIESNIVQNCHTAVHLRTITECEGWTCLSDLGYSNRVISSLRSPAHRNRAQPLSEDKKRNDSDQKTTQQGTKCLRPKHSRPHTHIPGTINPATNWRRPQVSLTVSWWPQKRCSHSMKWKDMELHGLARKFKKRMGVRSHWLALAD